MRILAAWASELDGSIRFRWLRLRPSFLDKKLQRSFPYLWICIGIIEVMPIDMAQDLLHIPRGDYVTSEPITGLGLIRLGSTRTVKTIQHGLKDRPRC